MINKFAVKAYWYFWAKKLGILAWYPPHHTYTLPQRIKDFAGQKLTKGFFTHIFVYYWQRKAVSARRAVYYFSSSLFVGNQIIINFKVTLYTTAQLIT